MQETKRMFILFIVFVFSGLPWFEFYVIIAIMYRNKKEKFWNLNGKLILI